MKRNLEIVLAFLIAAAFMVLPVSGQRANKPRREVAPKATQRVAPENVSCLDGFCVQLVWNFGEYRESQSFPGTVRFTPIQVNRADDVLYALVIGDGVRLMPLNVEDLDRLADPKVINQRTSGLSCIGETCVRIAQGHDPSLPTEYKIVPFRGGTGEYYDLIFTGEQLEVSPSGVAIDFRGLVANDSAQGGVARMAWWSCALVGPGEDQPCTVIGYENICDCLIYAGDGSSCICWAY